MGIVQTANQAKVTEGIHKITQIATLPEITSKIIQVVEDPRSTARDLQSIIKHDVALSAKILKVVNSAFYGLPRQIGSVDRAIILLGLSTVKNIAIATSMAKLFSGREISKKFSMKDLWRHSLACGVFCKMLTQARGIENCDEIFVAGLINDIGIIVEKQIFPNELMQAIELAESKQIDLCEAEFEVLEADHQAFGTALASKWKFPHLFQLATGYHHHPLRTSGQHQEIAATVHLADVLAGQKQIGFTIHRSGCDPDVPSLLGLSEDKITELLDAFDERFEIAESVMN